jgi:hypothetical protein
MAVPASRRNRLLPLCAAATATLILLGSVGATARAGQRSNGTVTMNDTSSISGNSAGTDGGGVYNLGTLSVNGSSSISNNTPDDTAP